jgi:hypothetical protein
MAAQTIEQIHQFQPQAQHYSITGKGTVNKASIAERTGVIWVALEMVNTVLGEDLVASSNLSV